MSSLGIDLQNFSISNFCTLGGTEDFRFITDQGPGFKFGSLISLANGNENIPLRRFQWSSQLVVVLVGWRFTWYSNRIYE
jgi:hypothetical protein